MANANLNITISGNGKGLKAALDSARAAVLDFSKDASKIDDIQQSFDAVSQSTMPLRMKLKAIQQMMAEMNMAGLDKTELFGRMAQEAGAVADAIGDARTAVNAFANDNMKLEATAQGFQLITGGASVLTGAMSMLGVENDKVQSAMLKVQSAIALVNGVTAIANVLNKDSALMLRLKAIRLAATTGAQTANTTATKVNTVAEAANTAITKASTVSSVANTASTTANTVATAANTVARNAWNVAVAIGKALFGDFTGLVLVGAAALTTYAIATSDSTDEIEKNNEAITASKKRYDDYTESVAKNCGDLVYKFRSLKSEWNQLKTVAEKTQWLKDNKTEFSNLGLSVNDLTTAERVFVNDTDKVVKALEARAKAMAAQTAIQDAYSQYYKTKMNNANTVEGGGYYNSVRAGQKVSKKEAVKAGIRINRNDIYSTHTLSEADANRLNTYRRNQAIERRHNNDDAALAELNKTLNFYNDEIEKSANEIAGLGLGKIINESKNNRSGGSGSGANRTEKIDYLVSVDDGSLQTAEKKLQAWTEKKKTLNIDDTEAIDRANKEIEKWQKEVILRKIALDGDDKVKATINEIKELENRKAEIIVQLNTADSAAQINELNKELNSIDNRLIVDYIKIGIKPEIEEGSAVDLENQIKELQNVRKVLLQTVADPEAIKAVDDEIKQLRKQLEAEEIRLGITPEIEAGSINYIKKLIKEKEDEIALALNTNIEPESMNHLQSELRQLRQLEQQKEIEIGVRTASPTVSKNTDTPFVRGSVDDKRQSLANAQSMVSEIQENYRLKLIDKDEVTSQLAEINSQLESLGLKPITLTFNDDGTLTTAAEDLERYRNQIENVSNITGNLGSTFNSLGSAIGGSTGEIMNFAGQSLNALSQIIPQIMTMITAKNAEAIAAGTASGAALPFPANIAAIAAIVAQIASVFAALPAFESGGVVGGTSYHGDKLLARVNSGELILNRKQQNNLYNSLSSAEVGAQQNTLHGDVNFTISGAALKGTLKNYESKMNKIK